MEERKKAVARIREANDRMTALFARWPEAPKSARASLLALVAELPRVFAAVESAGGGLSLDELAASGLSAEDQAASSAYFTNLRRLRRFLTELEPVLAERRDHLASAGLRLRDAKAWCDTLKMTR